MPATHKLPGIEADNLLAFLALLGTLRALKQERPEWRPRVFWSDLPIRPKLQLASEVARKTLLEAIGAGCSTLALVHEFDREDIKFSKSDARILLAEAAKDANPGSRARSDLLSALFSDGALNDDGDVRPTPLCTLFGQGHQHFLERLTTVPRGVVPKKLAKKMSGDSLNSVAKLDKALFSTWERIDPTQSFRWDPVEDRRYALRFEDPSSDEALTVHGANRLASLALPLLTAVPMRQRGKIQLSAGSTHYVPGAGMCVYWPVWSRPASLDAIIAMLACAPEELAERAGLGIIRIYRSERISVGKYVNFTRASTVL